ncbi:MAG: putative zinc-binding metallopeptidase [Limisphaerales bacterium]
MKTASSPSNIAEADEDEREHRRLQMHEPYRTLVGHLRHESGHYYWDRLIANSENLNRYRELFGDETIDYASALKTYYQQGPAAGWQSRTVTAYASSHPWEDWAETLGALPAHHGYLGNRRELWRER